MRIFSAVCLIARFICTRPYRLKPACLVCTSRGMTPAEADLYFLQNAKRMALYGMDFTQVKDNKSQVVLVGVAASGLYLYDERLRMESFKWPRIIKISYKAATFLIKVRPGEVRLELLLDIFRLSLPHL